MALAAYRHVLRSARIAFQGTQYDSTRFDILPPSHFLRADAYVLAGDARLLSAAKVEARSNFNNNRSLPADSDEAQQKIIEAQEVARILRQNVVQGQQVTGAGKEEQRYRAFTPSAEASTSCIMETDLSGKSLRGALC